MGVFDGEIIRVRAQIETRYSGLSVEERYAYDERHARAIVRGFKGRRSFGETTVAVSVDVLHFVTDPRPDLSFGEWRED